MNRAAIFRSCVAAFLLIVSGIPAAKAQTRLPDEPGSSPGVTLTDISGNVQLGNYSLGGDFATWVSGSKDCAHIVFPYSPGGITQKTTYARVDLARMK